MTEGAYARGRCDNIEGRQHQVLIFEYWVFGGRRAPWVTCTACGEVLWGLYLIEEDPW